MLKFRGGEYFRHRIVCATLCGRAIRIDQIRSQEQEPGLRDYEANLLRLVDKLTNGAIIEINETGTSMRYKPGIVLGGSGITHDCGKTRSIGYFLEALVLLGLFAKKPLKITLTGITNGPLDPSVDMWRTATLPLLKHFGVEEGLELKVVKRGAPPEGGGEVILSVPVMKELKSVMLTNEGMIRRVRGVAYSAKVSPQSSNRMVDSARGLLNKLLADVYIFTDHVSGQNAGKSPGFGLTLVAETTSGMLLSAECAAETSTSVKEDAASGNKLVVPEDVGAHAARCLLEEARRGGVVDGTHQGLLLLLCALGPEEVSKVRLGPLTPHAVRTLRHIKAFFGVQFSIKPEATSNTVFLSCIGAGIRNLARKVR